MTGLVRMVVESVRVHMLSNRHVVILKDVARERYLPIWIGAGEASAIAMRLQGIAPERPMTHDLFLAAIVAVGARIDRVVINELAEETYHARIVLELDGREIEVDARPSDALALAVRADVAILVADAVLDQAALGSDPDAEATEETGRAPLRGAPSESLGEAVVDPRLDLFRDFVNSLDVDPGSGRGGSSGSGGAG